MVPQFAQRSHLVLPLAPLQLRKAVQQDQTGEITRTIFQLNEGITQSFTTAADSTNHKGPFTKPPNSLISTSLEPVPQPTFKGDIAAFDNFLATFESSVNRTSLSDEDMLCESLEGEAKRLIYGFTPGGQSYQSAIELLKRRFGQKITLLDILFGQLQSTTLAFDQISDQRRLFDKLQVITC
ncbi:hypothetical protein QR680_010358 [Steinernema hermaphroditum]|uniref:Uncharacterized protein n=1 Tax=Steinernema hermaphroditum TaxID=289476 RepID=A0AA39INQ0_9BILA|nr:hypothetical protein QR680_010358 [Steinernema hermaphroditum]